MAKQLRMQDVRHKKEKFNSDNLETVSSIEQERVEKKVETAFDGFHLSIVIDPSLPLLHRDQHEGFLKKGIRNLPKFYGCLDSSRPWLCYWIVHSLELLNEHVSAELTSDIVGFLGRCQSKDGGFAGGPGQLAHLAPTYAAVNTLCILGTDEALKVVNRDKLYKFLMAMKCENGGFKMQDGGEKDVRGAYCALAAASLCNIMTRELIDGLAPWIVRCQTYEGGFAGTPGMEAHGGYSFCGLAALVILGKERLCNLENLLKWTVNRQMKFEGGFQGRTNKLVDGCYSFWQGGIFPLLHRIFSQDDSCCVSMEKWLFHQEALQEYLLICCQDIHGGVIDKPGRNRDYYHTCYGLSGLSVAQHFAGGNLASKYIVGDPENELAQTHPIYNIGSDAVIQAYEYFKKLPLPGKSSDSTSTKENDS